MIDFHCHLDLYPDALKLLPLVSSRNSFTLVVTTSPRAWEKTSKIFSQYDNIKVAVGLHPEIIAKKANERPLLISYISQCMYVGEVGLDGSDKCKDTLPLQESIFKDVLTRCEMVGGRIISIHSRNAVGPALDLIEQNCQSSVPVLHWFTGSIKEVKRAIDLKCWFSIGPAMLRTTNGQKIIRELPISKILPETDGPFATHYNSPLMPWEAITIVDYIAPIFKMPKDEICIKLKNNLDKLIDSMKKAL